MLGDLKICKQNRCRRLLKCTFNSEKPTPRFFRRFNSLPSSYVSWNAYGIISHLRTKSGVFRDSCEEHVIRSITSGQGVQGRQRFLDEDGILQAHRSITAAEDKFLKESQLAEGQGSSFGFSS
jgi:hypothetical protein